MDVLSVVVPSVVAALMAFILTPPVRRLAIRAGAIDAPDARKVHREPIPRLGGLAVLAAVLTGFLMIMFGGRFSNRVLDRELLIGIAIGIIPVLVVSVIDDVRSLRAAPKFLAHFAGAGLAVMMGIRLGSQVHLFGEQIEIGWLAIPISLLWIAGVTNAFNLVDGLDGLSAGLALISAISLGSVSILVGRYEMAVAAFIIAGALAGFLPFNAHPAKIFLGDTGSATVGFLLGCIALRGGSALNAGMAILLPLVVLGLPIAETLVSMLRRLILRFEGGTDGVFEADRRHFHHRLLDLGLDHRKVVYVLYGVGLLLAIVGFLSILLTTTYSAFLLGTVLIAAFIGIGRLGYDEFAVVRRGTMLRFYDTPVLKTQAFVVFADFLVVVMAIWMAIALKWDDWGVDLYRTLGEEMLVIVPPIALLVFWSFGVYRGSWRVASVEDLLRSSAAAVVTAGAGGVVVTILPATSPPVSFFILYGLVLMFLVNGMRASYRLFAHWNARLQTAGVPVLIYGAGKGGVMALREILMNRDIEMWPVGFLDDDPRLLGRQIQGYTVYGSIYDARHLLASGLAQTVVVSSEKISEENLQTLREACESVGAELRWFTMRFSELRGTLNDER